MSASQPRVPGPTVAVGLFPWFKSLINVFPVSSEPSHSPSENTGREAWQENVLVLGSVFLFRTCQCLRHFVCFEVKIFLNECWTTLVTSTPEITCSTFVSWYLASLLFYSSHSWKVELGATAVTALLLHAEMKNAHRSHAVLHHAVSAVSCKNHRAAYAHTNKSACGNVSHCITES